ncbi:MULTISPECIES: trypsin-like serine peptidase [Calothrix]|uniref:Serine protease n=2 Tax=Calothrix TaxID=1186 RepID=A0ABR8AHN5_9CYAN|nr:MULTISPECIES: serine protease [Calothrix]MBD2199424.1 trypsin-like peptidase domain-containing protein [Calothrix parietina FACHB-288]MBD2228225.1 trypsin-like peptidase domain-containing protein [Calothrix anomala FACHB-343]
MKGLPSDLNQRCFNLFLDCEYFDSFETLRSFCESFQELTALSRQLKKADSKWDLVDRNLSTISNNYHDIYNWILPIFIEKLQERYKIRQDPLWRKFQNLHSEIINLSIVETSPQSDLKPEANPKGEPFYYLAADEKVLNSARAVARVSTLRNSNKSPDKVLTETGTAWLVTPNLVLTCRHVIESVYPQWECNRFHDCDVDIKEEIQNKIKKNVVLTFNYKQPSQGIEYGVEQLEDDNIDLDYAVLRLCDRKDHPLKNMGFLQLDINAPLTSQLKLHVIQHPKGQPQQRSVGDFVKYASNNKQILHNAPTEGGTSGAPVLNLTNCQVVALHIGENENKALRTATLISAILSDMEQNNSTLYQEILAVQSTHQH